MVRTALEAREAGDKFDWNKTWIAEMLLSGEESVRRAAKIDRIRGVTPETRRRNEIKAGVITGSTGVGLTIALFVIMQGIILSGEVSQAAIAILSRVWIVGLIPMFVGAALIVNGAFVSRQGNSEKQTEIATGETETETPMLEFPARAETNQLPAEMFSVTDETTKHLKETLKAKKTADLP